MIVLIKEGASASAVTRELSGRGLWVDHTERAPSGGSYLVVAAHSAAIDPEEIASIDGVAEIALAGDGHPLVSRQEPCPEIAGVRFGGAPVLLCGPCSVESEEHVFDMARALALLGVAFLRGGAFKPRTSPYAFQGHGVRALAWLRRAADACGMRVVSEALSEAHAGAVAEVADLVQIGARNMHNTALLKAVGRTGRPVLLKRGLAATIDEWLLAGEYLLQAGAPNVVFCERGIRSFDTSTRNVLDLGAVALLSHAYAQPVIVDPSHAAGRRDLVEPLARAAVAAGASGLLIETHDSPAQASSDGPQAVPLERLPALLDAVRCFEPPRVERARSLPLDAASHHASAAGSPS